MLFSNLNEEEFELFYEFEKDGIIYKEVRLKNGMPLPGLRDLSH